MIPSYVPQIVKYLQVDVLRPHYFKVENNNKNWTFNTNK